MSAYDIEHCKRTAVYRKADDHNYRLAGVFWGLIIGLFWLGCIS